MDAPVQVGIEHAPEAETLARTPFQKPSFARAFTDDPHEVQTIRIARASEPLTHVTLLERARHGFASWVGLAEPAIETAAERAAVWNALIEAAKARGIVSLGWREAALARLTNEDVATARTVVERLGGHATVGAFVTHTLDLEQTPDALWQRIHRKHRHAIRAAEGARLRVTREDPRTFLADYPAMSDGTFALAGQRGPSPAYFERLLAEGTRHRWLDALMARDEHGRAIAGALIAHTPTVAVYLHGASTRDVPGASALVQWSALQAMKTRGIPRYDLGGTTLPGGPGDSPRADGIRRFKARWGGDETILPLLHLVLDPPRYAQAREAAMQALQRAH